MATLESLQAKIAKLQAQAESIVKKDSSAVIAKIRAIMDKHGLTTADIEAHVGGARKRGRKPGIKLAAKPSAATAKYRDPKTGATWTGHGRAPAWIASAKDRSKFLVEGKSVASTPATKKPATKKPAKAGDYVRGPQPAVFADPKTGTTWSGRGRAPAWMADAKDRSKFLIAEAGAGKAEPKAVAADKASAKKVIVKRATAKTTMSAKTSASKKAPVKKGTAKKAVPAASKKASTKKVSMTEAAVTAQMGTVESGAGSAT
ncbi:DNA-binding protein H-NS [Paraburkholderia sp. JPY465]|uniref:H-NS histone family protein n=1 Tax=Paraburkholderia sp. JPY465 TaxID=3042285 RepID=UPI003D23971B